MNKRMYLMIYIQVTSWTGKAMWWNFMLNCTREKAGSYCVKRFIFLFKSLHGGQRWWFLVSKYMSIISNSFLKKFENWQGIMKQKNRKFCCGTPIIPIAMCLLIKSCCLRLFGEVLPFKHKVNYHLRRRAHPFSFLIINQGSSGEKESIKRRRRRNQV